MQFLQSFFTGPRNNQQANNNSNQQPTRQQPQPQDPSMRGGLPKVVDMLRATNASTLNRKDINIGNKVLLPDEILHLITNQFEGNLPHPMIFSVSTLRTRKTSYVGVLEFVAPPNTIVLPDWLFDQLQLNKGEMIWLGIVDFLPKANFAKIRPHKTEFIELPDPKAVLEIHLRNFVCLTQGDSININFANKDFKVDILELKPQSQYNTGIIIDTDLTIEFEQPLDYVEPVKQNKNIQNEKQKEFGAQLTKAVTIGGMIKENINFNEEKTNYDPWQHRIKNGIWNEWFQKKSFQGKAIKISG